MMIEGAFLKIPEVLHSYGDRHYLYESSITHLFSNSLMLELNARNIDNPLNKIFFEKRYDPKINQRCDIYTYFDFIDAGLSNYGSYQENYIEVKYFGNLNRKRGTEVKSENAGSIMYDIYRLIEGTQSIDVKGLYSLVIFDDNPSRYLAFSKHGGGKRYWLKTLLEPGIHTIKFDLKKEPKTVRNIFQLNQLTIVIKIRVLTFSPIHSEHGFHGSLIQIIEVL